MTKTIAEQRAEAIDQIAKCEQNIAEIRQLGGNDWDAQEELSFWHRCLFNLNGKG